MSNVTDSMIHALKKPMALKWRVLRAYPNNTNPTHVILAGYVDSRDVMGILDDNVGPENWQDDYFESKGKQFCRISINYNGQWVSKCDSGTPSTTEKEKGETSDAFKRAAVKWGINRFGYQTGEVKLKCRDYNGKPYPCDDAGNFLKGQKLNDLCNSMINIDKMEVEFEESMKKFDGAGSELKDKKDSIKSTPGRKSKTPPKLP